MAVAALGKLVAMLGDDVGIGYRPVTQVGSSVAGVCSLRTLCFVPVRFGHGLPPVPRLFPQDVWAERLRRRSGHRVTLKAPIGGGLGSARDQAALGLVAAAQAPGVVWLLATSMDLALLVLADVGDGPTLADQLVADDPVVAETAVLTWAARLPTSPSGSHRRDARGVRAGAPGGYRCCEPREVAGRRLCPRPAGAS